MGLHCYDYFTPPAAAAANTHACGALLGILELVWTAGLVVPAAFHWRPPLTIMAATVLAVESLVFVGVHVMRREVAPMILSGVLGFLMAFIAYGRMVLQPIF